MESTVFKKVTHYIYDSVGEFEKEFMIKEGVVPRLVQDWRDGEIGDWVVSDDNRIVQIFGRKTYKKKNCKDPSIFIRTVVGTFVVATDKMDTDLTLRIYPQGRYEIGKNHASWRVKQKYRTKLSGKEKELLTLLFDGEEKVQAYFKVYKCNYLNMARTKVNNLLKQPRIIGAIMGKTIKELAKDLGVGVEDQLKKYKELLDKDEGTEKTLAVLEKLGKIVDIEEERTPKGLLPANSTFVQIKAHDRKTLIEAKSDGGSVEDVTNEDNV